MRHRLCPAEDAVRRLRGVAVSPLGWLWSFGLALAGGLLLGPVVTGDNR